MIKLTVHSQNDGDRQKILSLPEKKSLTEVLRGEFPDFRFPCAGTKKCGQCLVWVRGNFSGISQEERNMLSRWETHPTPKPGYVPRQACFCQVTGDGDIILPKSATAPATASFSEKLPAYDGRPEDLTGAAIDIGTTTISLALYDLHKGLLLETVHTMNLQAAHGADVLSRIVEAKKKGHTVLGCILRKQIEEMIHSAADKRSLPVSGISRLVLTGNTTMLHFFTDLDPESIGVAPFLTQSLFGDEYRASQYLPSLDSHTVLYIPPCIGAYIGADITCGLLYSHIFAPDKTWLLVDVGTNGEMILQTGDRILCCATAAGPAFEGAEIQMGMPAVAGAIYKVAIKKSETERGSAKDTLPEENPPDFTWGDDPELSVWTVDHAAPAGLCGTGLISIVNLMLQEGVLDGSGRINDEDIALSGWVEEKEKDTLFHIGCSGVLITQKDIRNIQLAKAAVAAGIDTLLHEANLMSEDLDILYLAGGFGSGIDAAEAAGIGLIPDALISKVRVAGNTALKGAVHMLFSQKARTETQTDSARAKEVSLSTHPVFMDRYIENMAFTEE